MVNETLYARKLVLEELGLPSTADSTKKIGALIESENRAILGLLKLEQRLFVAGYLGMLAASRTYKAFPFLTSAKTFPQKTLQEVIDLVTAKLTPAEKDS
ncbi:MAG: hypothetical protein PHZ00_06010 [Candidatus Peribacteraceae bacterium]|nr:hypothetical protein [Candidatus Peribacteraceae bacterium]